MGSPSRHETFDYLVDDSDLLRRVERRPGTDAPGEGEGESLWDNVHGDALRHFYATVLEHVRRTGEPVRIPFRCDAPDCRRDMRLQVAPLPGGWARFTTELIAARDRPPIPLLAADAPRTGETLRICSMCLDIHMADGTWLPLESAVEALGLTGATAFPRLSHGMCPACFQREMAALEAGGDPPGAG